jgi:hypothetical protein
MNYFKVLGSIFGLAALLKPFYMHLLPWDEKSFIENSIVKSVRPISWPSPCSVLAWSR